MAWAVLEVDGSPVTLFVTMNVLDLDPRGEDGVHGSPRGVRPEGGCEQGATGAVLVGQVLRFLVSAVRSAHRSHCP